MRHKTRVKTTAFNHVRNWAKERHIKQSPTNENFVYYAHKWIQLTFPDAAIEVFEPPKAEQSLDSSDLDYLPQATTTLTLSNALQPSVIQHYTILRQEAGTVFATALLRKAFKAWSKAPIRVVQFVKKREGKAAMERFKMWKTKSDWKIAARQKVAGFTAAKRQILKKVPFFRFPSKNLGEIKQKLFQKILRKLLERSSDKQAIRQLSEKVCSVTELRRKVKVLKGLREVAARKIAEKTKCSQLQTAKKVRTLHITVKVWSEKAKRVVMKAKNKAVSEKVARKNRLKNHWGKWRQEFWNQQKDRLECEKADQFHRRKLLEHSVINWQNVVVKSNWKFTYDFFFGGWDSGETVNKIKGVGDCPGEA